MYGNVVVEIKDKKNHLNNEIPANKIIELNTSQVEQIMLKLNLKPKNIHEFFWKSIDLISKELQIEDLDSIENEHEYLNFLIYYYYSHHTKGQYKRTQIAEELHCNAYPFIVEMYQNNGDLIHFKQFRIIEEAIEHFKTLIGYDIYLREYNKSTLVHHSCGKYLIDKLGISKEILDLVPMN